MKYHNLLVIILLFLVLFVNSIKFENKVGSKLSLNTQTKSQAKITTTQIGCNPLCLECSTNDQNYCQVCKVGIFQYNFNCFTHCPDGTFLDEKWQKCRVCDVNCPVCWGPASDMCGATTGLRTSVSILENEVIIDLK